MIRLIDAKKYERDLLKAYDDVSMEFDVLDKQPTVDAIIIPKGATNGDVIKALFPNAENIRVDGGYPLNYIIEGEWHRNLKEWWDAPYKADKESN